MIVYVQTLRSTVQILMSVGVDECVCVCVHSPTGVGVCVCV